MRKTPWYTGIQPDYLRTVADLLDTTAHMVTDTADAQDRDAPGWVYAMVADCDQLRAYVDECETSTRKR